LAGNLFGSPHRFRIDWTPSQVVYWVDGVKVATHNVAITQPLRPLVSDVHADATNLSVDWMQMTPFGGACTYVSRAADAGHPVGWLALEPTTTTPANTNVTFDTRTSNDAVTWSAWSPVNGTTVASPNGRYLQYRASLSTSDPASTPLVTAVKLTADDRPTAPIGVAAVPGNGAATLSWTAASNNGSPINAYIITPYKAGVAQAPMPFSTATTQTVGGLTNATSYTFTVAAKNGIGVGPASRATQAITIGAPIAPTNVTAKAGTGNATVSWNAPGQNNTSPVSGYVVTPYVGAVALPPRRFTTTAVQQTVTGLQKGTSYRFTVAAVNARGTGPESVLSNAVSPK
jgi:hypothetical protein